MLSASHSYCKESPTIRSREEETVRLKIIKYFNKFIKIKFRHLDTDYLWKKTFVVRKSTNLSHFLKFHSSYLFSWLSSNLITKNNLKRLQREESKTTNIFVQKTLLFLNKNMQNHLLELNYVKINKWVRKKIFNELIIQFL